MPELENLREETWQAIENDGLWDYPPEALARIALSAAAQELADSASSLVPTSSDGYAHGGEFVETAARLVGDAERLLRRAVIYERERGRSWETIGGAMGIKRQTAHERFAGDVEEWQAAFDRPYEPQGQGLCISTLPDGAARPTWTAQYLDKWVATRAEPSSIHHGEEHPVSGNLIDEERLTLGLSSAVTSSASRWSDLQKTGGVMDPIAERAFWERKRRLYERLAIEDPAGYGATAEEVAVEARTKLAELKAVNS